MAAFSAPRALPRADADTASVVMPGAVPKTMPAPTPWRTRAPSNELNVGALAPKAKASAVSASPAQKTRACPMRSARAPAANERKA